MVSYRFKNEKDDADLKTILTRNQFTVQLVFITLFKTLGTYCKTNTRVNARVIKKFIRRVSNYINI